MQTQWSLNLPGLFGSFFLFCQVHAKHSYKGNLLPTLNRGRQAAGAPHVKGLIEGKDDLVICAQRPSVLIESTNLLHLYTAESARLCGQQCLQMLLYSEFTKVKCLLKEDSMHKPKISCQLPMNGPFDSHFCIPNSISFAKACRTQGHTRILQSLTALNLNSGFLSFTSFALCDTKLLSLIFSSVKRG